MLRERLDNTPRERRARVCGLQLVLAVDLGATKYVEELLELSPDPNVRDQSGFSALMHTARSGDCRTVERLLELGADPLARKPEKPFDSVIDWARYGGHPEVIELLSRRLGLDEAADAELDKLDGDDLRKEANRLAAMAASEGRWQRVEALLHRGAKIDARGKDGRTLLMYAILDGDHERVSWLVEHGADLEATCDRDRAIDSYARESDYGRPHRVAVLGRSEPETWMVELIEELRSRA